MRTLKAFALLDTKVKKLGMPKKLDTKVLKAEMGNDAGIIGSALLGE